MVPIYSLNAVSVYKLATFVLRTLCLHLTFLFLVVQPTVSGKYSIFEFISRVLRGIRHLQFYEIFIQLLT